MDDLTCSGEVVEQTLRELDFINKWLGGDQVTLDAVNRLIDRLPYDREIVIDHFIDSLSVSPYK